MILFNFKNVNSLTVAGKELEDEQKESYGDAEWKERVEKWKNRQEKRGLVNNGGNDQPDEDDDYLYVLFLFTLTCCLPSV